MCIESENFTTPKLQFFSCSFPKCKKEFRYNSELQRHLVSHDNTKAFLCNYPSCNKSFKRQDALRVHLQSHTENSRISCTVPGCASQFKSQPSLKYHLRKYHKDRKDSPKVLSDKRASFIEKALDQEMQSVQETLIDDLNKHSIRIHDFNSLVEDIFESKDEGSEPRKLLHIEREQKEDSSTCCSESSKAKSGFGKNTTKISGIDFLQSLYDNVISQNAELKKKLADTMMVSSGTEI